jgi:hypothetical protein
MKIVIFLITLFASNFLLANDNAVKQLDKFECKRSQTVVGILYYECNKDAPKGWAKFYAMRIKKTK